MPRWGGDDGTRQSSRFSFTARTSSRLSRSSSRLSSAGGASVRSLGSSLRNLLAVRKKPKEDLMTVAAAFHSLDKDGSGKLSVDELREALTRPGGGAPLTDDEVRAIINEFDDNNDGELAYDEVRGCCWLLPRCVPDARHRARARAVYAPHVCNPSHNRCLPARSQFAVLWGSEGYAEGEDPTPEQRKTKKKKKKPEAPNRRGAGSSKRQPTKQRNSTGEEDGDDETEHEPLRTALDLEQAEAAERNVARKMEERAQRILSGETFERRKYTRANTRTRLSHEDMRASICCLPPPPHTHNDCLTVYALLMLCVMRGMIVRTQDWGARSFSTSKGRRRSQQRASRPR